VLLAKASSLGLRLLERVRLAKLLRRSVAFVCQTPDDSSPSKLLLDLLGHRTEH